MQGCLMTILLRRNVIRIDYLTVTAFGYRGARYYRKRGHDCTSND